MNEMQEMWKQIAELQGYGVVSIGPKYTIVSPEGRYMGGFGSTKDDAWMFAMDSDTGGLPDWLHDRSAAWGLLDYVMSHVFGVMVGVSHEYGGWCEITFSNDERILAQDDLITMAICKAYIEWEAGND